MRITESLIGDIKPPVGHRLSAEWWWWEDTCPVAARCCLLLCPRSCWTRLWLQVGFGAGWTWGWCHAAVLVLATASEAALRELGGPVEKDYCLCYQGQSRRAFLHHHAWQWLRGGGFGTVTHTLPTAWLEIALDTGIHSALSNHPCLCQVAVNPSPRG